MSASNRSATKHPPSPWADGGLLLDALPIPAAIIEYEADNLRISAHNCRFLDAVAISTAGTLDGLRAQCLSGEGLVASYLTRWFDCPETETCELDMRDGSGVAARF